MSQEKKKEPLSPQTIKRLPYYMQALERRKTQGEEWVSAAAVARELGFYEVQVRKEFAAVSSQEGRPGIGFSTLQLMEDMEKALGYLQENQAVVVGAGQLGRALLSYHGFSDYGIHLDVGFDVDRRRVGTTVAGKPIYSLDLLPDYCRKNPVDIGVITVPASAAQEVCDLLVASGVKAIWNFAPTRLEVPPGVFLQVENMVSSIAMLSRHLSEGKKEEEPHA